MTHGLNPILPVATTLPSTTTGQTVDSVGAHAVSGVDAFEFNELDARKLAMRAQSENAVAAYVEAISAPITAQEIEALEAMSTKGAGARAEQTEGGASAVRTDC